MRPGEGGPYVGAHGWAVIASYPPRQRRGPWVRVPQWICQSFMGYTPDLRGVWGSEHGTRFGGFMTLSDAGPCHACSAFRQGSCVLLLSHVKPRRRLLQKEKLTDSCIP